MTAYCSILYYSLLYPFTSFLLYIICYIFSIIAYVRFCVCYAGEIQGKMHFCMLIEKCNWIHVQSDYFSGDIDSSHELPETGPLYQ